MALHKELVQRKEEFSGTTVQTIYFGGGTPSVLTVAELVDLYGTIVAHYKLDQNPEITLEANPDDLSTPYLLALAQSPINRLSIGVQSFFDQDLQWMNRAHNAKEAKDALAFAVTHFDAISLDLIYGIPGMDSIRWLENIQQALTSGVSHISAYALTVEPHTALQKFIQNGKVQPIDDALAQEQFEILVQELTHAGFEHYEFSNFGKPKCHSRNNTAYWQGKPYLGIGPSAHSYDGTSRSWNIRNNSQYCKAIAAGELPSSKEVLSLKDRYNEYVMTGLRTMWGVSLEAVERLFGSLFREYLWKESQKHREQSLLELKADALVVTGKGKFLTDGIAADLFLVNLK